VTATAVTCRWAFWTELPFGLVPNRIDKPAAAAAEAINADIGLLGERAQAVPGLL
jgi:hypothetical protein